MSTQTGSISFEATGGFNSYAKQNYATLSQIKGQFATCGTGAATAAKVATIVPADSGWTLYEGATVTVKFTSKNTAATPTLNVNNTGAKQIRDYNGDELTKEAREWLEGSAIALTYDGTYWRIQDSNLMERMYSAETAIEQNANAILLSATKEEVENIQIGGRNLFRNTSTLSYEGNNNTAMILQDTTGWFRWNSGATIERTSDGLKCSLAGNSSSGFVIPLVRENILIPDQKYTISFNYRGTITDTGGIHLLCRSGGNVSLGSFMSFSVSETEWKYYKYTFTCADYGTKTLYALLIPYTIQDGKWLEIKDASAQLELGNKATDWTPAPEDIEAYTDKQVSAAKLEINAEGIRSEVSKITSAKYVNSLTSLWTLASIKTYAAEGHQENWNVASTENFRVGDTIYIKGTDSTRSCPVYIKTTVKTINSATNFTGISHGYEDVLPVDTIKSTINQSSDTVKIQAKHIEIDGTATFKNSDNTTTTLGNYLSNNYDSKGSAAAVQTNLDNLEISNRNLLLRSATLPNASSSNWQTGTWRLAGSSGMTRSFVDISDPPYNVSATRAFQCVGSQGWTDGSAIGIDSFPKIVGDYYVVSCWARVVGGGIGYVGFSCYSTMYISGWDIELSQYGYKSTMLDSTGEWTRCHVVVKATAATGNIYIGAHTMSSSTDTSGNSATIQICAPMIQHANKLADWAPAPEDVDAAIEAVPGFKYLNSNYTNTLATVQGWCVEGKDAGNWTVTSTAGVRVGDTVYIKTVPSDNNGKPVYCIVTVETVVSATVVKGISHGYLNTAVTDIANAAAPKASAVSRTQRIYYQSNSTTKPTTPGTASSNWVTDETGAADKWTLKRMSYSSTKPYIYTCEQKQVVSGTVSYTPVLLDDTTTVIDGGKIITGSIAANRIDADSGTFNTANIPNLNASKINAGDITADRIKTNVVNAINATVNKIDAKNINVSSINIGDLSGTIGGKNLALDSDQPYNWQKYTPTTYELAQVKMTEDFIPGETYTVTIWGGPITRSDKSNCWYALYWGGGNFSLANATLVETGIYRATFTISTTSTAQHTAAGIGVLSIYNTPAVGASGTTYSAPITKIQIEKGNIGTEWEPAQEELPRPNLYKTITEMGYIGSGAATLSAYDDSYHGRTLTITTAGGTLRISHIIPKTNIPYTVSFILDASVATTITVDIMDNTTQAIKVPKGISKVIFTSTPTRTLDSTYHFIDMVFADAGTYKMENIKVEMGTVATAWVTAEQISNYIHVDSTGINIYDNRLSNANKYYLRQTAGGTYIYRNSYLKAKYEDTITLYGGSNTSGANPKVELTSTDFKMTDSGGTQRLLLNSTNGAIIGKPDKGRTQITDAGMTVYDTNNKKRTQVDANGLHVYNTDGSTETGLFGAATARIGSTTGPAFYMNDSSLQAYYMNGTTRTKYFEVSPTSITYGGFVEQTITTATDFNTLKTTGTYHIKVSSNTNAPTTGHGVLTVEWNVGTPYQIWQPDSTTTAYYKRKWTSSDSTWTTWTKIDAVDAAKTASNYMKFDSTNGLIIAQSSPSTTAYPLVQITPSSGIFIKQSATSYSKITSSSMEIYVPVSSTATKVASFGTTATIGQTSTGRVEVTSTGVGLYNKNNKMKVSIGTGNSIFYGGEGTYPYIELGTTATSAINIRQSATSYTSITSSGLDIYTTVSSAATKIASFGTTATIGATNNAHFIMAANKLQAFSSTNTTTPYFEVSASAMKYGSYTVANTGDVANAGNTASLFITPINDNEIKLHSKTGKASNNYAKMNSDGLWVYKQNNLVAKFSDSITLGKETRTRVEVDFNSFRMLDRNGNKYCHISDLRNESGSIYLEEEFVVPDSGRVWPTFEYNKNYVTIYFNQTAYTYDSGIIIYESTTNTIGGSANRPMIKLNTTTIPVGSTITVKYLAIDDRLKGYTFGIRNETDSDKIGGLSFSEGYHTSAIGHYSHSEGEDTTASGRSSHAEGASTTASGLQSHAEGWRSVASGEGSHAEGGSHTGTWSIASGSFSHAEGVSKAAGRWSHAENGSTANGDWSHAEGTGTANGSWSHAEGNGKATGSYSHAEGSGTASGYYSHASGAGTVAGYDDQFVCGKYNSNQSTSLFEIGNGTNSKSANALTVDTSGNLTASGTITANKDLTFGNGTTATLIAKTPSRTAGVLWVGGSKKAAGDANGTVVRLQGGGLMLVGGGEYPTNRYNLANLNDGTENLYLGADGTVYIESNGNTIANRKTFTFGTDGSFNSPGTIKQNGTAVSLSGTSLFENASGRFSGKIDFSETAANFTFIEIYCKDNDGRYCYTKVWSPNGKTVNVTQTLSYGGNFYIKSKAYTISGAGMDTANTSGTYHTGEVNAAGSNSGSSSDILGVVKVIGYK